MPTHNNGEILMYKIIRFRFNGNNTTIKTGLTLEEAQAHCKDPETSGSTCSDLSKRGMWFDGYTEE
jgi:hypothetical protein|tara:strand:+ start:42 stop:239 length:198 start_codon:yes stop_codon:yes gene_type:complete